MHQKFLYVTGGLFAASMLISMFFLFAVDGAQRPVYVIDIFCKTAALALVFFLARRFRQSDQKQERSSSAPAAAPVFESSHAARLAPKITFADVAGLEEAKEELLEIVQFLRQPQAYLSMGASLPKGILFYGPPGTGKTLLAKALCGESQAFFHHVCGAEFVEKYVGVGSKRVRSLFEQARRQTPAIIFIDEIDAVGAKRSTESNNEKEQTLNQLLVEMDGFSSDHSVLVVGATNRLDLLDEALLRPGRFDRQIYIGSPDVRVREQILSVHFKNKPIENGLCVKSIAKRTSGMTGAHLAHIANEAAILAVRFGKSKISAAEVEQAIEKTLAGPERKHAVISAQEKRKIALHEAGHALLAKYFTNSSVEKISLIPRGMALGYTLQMPEENQLLVTKDELLARIKVLLGGRAAEMLIFGELSSGARDDLQKANAIAKEMICSLGMGKFSHVVYDEWGARSCYHKISSEIKEITDSCYQAAENAAALHKGQLLALAEALLERETLCQAEIDAVLGVMGADQAGLAGQSQNKARAAGYAQAPADKNGAAAGYAQALAGPSKAAAGRAGILPGQNEAAEAEEAESEASSV